MSRTTITRKGQVVIPAEIRRHLGISAGQQFEVGRQGSRITLTPVKTLSASQAKGWLGTKESAAELLAEARRQEVGRAKKLLK